MNEIYVVIKDKNGQFSVGSTDRSSVKLGEKETITLHNENGYFVQKTGKVIEIL